MSWRYDASMSGGPACQSEGHKSWVSPLNGEVVALAGGLR